MLVGCCGPSDTLHLQCDTVWCCTAKTKLRGAKFVWYSELIFFLYVCLGSRDLLRKSLFCRSLLLFFKQNEQGMLGAGWEVQGWDPGAETCVSLPRYQNKVPRCCSVCSVFVLYFLLSLILHKSEVSYEPPPFCFFCCFFPLTGGFSAHV